VKASRTGGLWHGEDRTSPLRRAAHPDSRRDKRLRRAFTLYIFALEARSAIARVSPLVITDSYQERNSAGFHTLGTSRIASLFDHGIALTRPSGSRAKHRAKVEIVAWRGLTCAGRDRVARCWRSERRWPGEGFAGPSLLVVVDALFGVRSEGDAAHTGESTSTAWLGAIICGGLGASPI
jgi:hypothetical protein